MASLLTACARTLVLGAVAALPTAVKAVVPYQPNGSQYAIVGSIPGDQTKAKVAVNRTGGYVVWQDNVSDNSGFGISARRLDANFSGDRNVFRVNEDAAGDQENPQVLLLPNGGALFTWQGGAKGNQDIRARFIGADNTFTSGDFIVNTHTAGQQQDAAVSCLSDGTVVVVWASDGQDGSMQGVFGQRLSATGEKLGQEFQVSESTQWNQRAPALAPLPNAAFAVTWVNESGSDVTGQFDISVQGRLFTSTGPSGSEFRINAGTNVCASPTIAAMSQGGFMVAWAERSTSLTGDGWDVLSRAFDGAGAPRNFGPRVNAQVFGDQYAPQLAGGREECLLLWTSMGQDGSHEGVYGRFLSSRGIIFSEEFRVNATTVSRQINPVVTSDGNNQFVAVWSSFVGGNGSFDLFAQRFEADSSPIPQPAAPYVLALSSTELAISWAKQEGLAVQGYDLYIDGATTPVSVAENTHLLAGLAPSSSHSVKFTYFLADGRRSPESPVATGRTWSPDANGDSLPDDWQTDNWGKPVNWPPASADSDHDGASNLQEFLAGTDPTLDSSVLKTRMERNGPLSFLTWNSVPGCFYQVQKTPAVGGDWSNLGSSRFANGSTDSLPVEGPEDEAFYRVIRLR